MPGRDFVFARANRSFVFRHRYQSDLAKPFPATFHREPLIAHNAKHRPPYYCDYDGGDN